MFLLQFSGIMIGPRNYNASPFTVTWFCRAAHAACRPAVGSMADTAVIPETRRRPRHRRPIFDSVRALFLMRRQPCLGGRVPTSPCPAPPGPIGTRQQLEITRSPLSDAEIGSRTEPGLGFGRLDSAGQGSETRSLLTLLQGRPGPGLEVFPPASP